MGCLLLSPQNKITIELLLFMKVWFYPQMFRKEIVVLYVHVTVTFRNVRLFLWPKILTQHICITFYIKVIQLFVYWRDRR